nr:hypothetical protein [Tanacetum cinerariifolium]
MVMAWRWWRWCGVGGDDEGRVVVCDDGNDDYDDDGSDDCDDDGLCGVGGVVMLLSWSRWGWSGDGWPEAPKKLENMCVVARVRIGYITLIDLAYIV